MRILALVVFSMFVVLVGSRPSSAQTTADAEKKAIVATAMKLNEEEATAFWPVYDEFQADLGKLDLRMTELIQIYAETWRSLDDETARGLLSEHLDIGRDYTGLRSSYVGRFRELLPEVKVLRYYQIEHKLHATVQFGLAEKVPLVP